MLTNIFRHVCVDMASTVSRSGSENYLLTPRVSGHVFLKTLAGYVPHLYVFVYYEPKKIVSATSVMC